MTGGCPFRRIRQRESDIAAQFAPLLHVSIRIIVGLLFCNLYGVGGIGRSSASHVYRLHGERGRGRPQLCWVCCLLPLCVYIVFLGVSVTELYLAYSCLGVSEINAAEPVSDRELVCRMCRHSIFNFVDAGHFATLAR